MSQPPKRHLDQIRLFLHSTSVRPTHRLWQTDTRLRYAWHLHNRPHLCYAAMQSDATWKRFLISRYVLDWSSATKCAAAEARLGDPQMIRSDTGLFISAALPALPFPLPRLCVQRGRRQRWSVSSKRAASWGLIRETLRGQCGRAPRRPPRLPSQWRRSTVDPWAPTVGQAVELAARPAACQEARVNAWSTIDWDWSTAMSLKRSVVADDLIYVNRPCFVLRTAGRAPTMTYIVDDVT